MDITINPILLQSVFALVAGVLIFMRPAILSYIVAIYLIAFGILGVATQLNI